MRRRAVFVAGLGLGAMVLAGCGSGPSTRPAVTGGVAARSDAFTVTQAEVDEDMTAVLTALGRAPGDPPAGMATAVVERLVQGDLVQTWAALLGVELTAGQVSAGVAELAEANGGMDALGQAALQSYIPSAAVTDVVRTNMLFAEAGRKLAAEGSADEQTSAASTALVEYAASIDVEVAPRYGTWDDTRLTIVAGSSVTSPAPSPSS